MSSMEDCPSSKSGNGERGAGAERHGLPSDVAVAGRAVPNPVAALPPGWCGPAPAVSGFDKPRHRAHVSRMIGRVMVLVAAALAVPS